MVNPRLASISTDTLSSALGITRISHVSVSQVLHATATDISVLNSHLSSWGVNSFRSYPLLLRALTHPSISNWAERCLDLPKRSLGSKTVELLGDTVVGTVCARSILSWLTDPTACPSGVHWTGSARKLLPTLVGNRGMAHTARSVGIERLMRWEKSTPPSAHRGRVDEFGVEINTGLQSNVEINALANAFEAVAAATYLNGGLPCATAFIDNTLLKTPASVQALNKDSAQYQTDLWNLVTELFAEPVHFIKRLPVQLELQRQRQQQAKHLYRNQHVYHSQSAERVQLQLFDLQQNPSSNTSSNAHPLFFSAVTVRQRPMSYASANNAAPLRESEIIALVSHFSVENARIAAITKAMEMLNGKCELTPPVAASHGWISDKVVNREIPSLGSVVDVSHEENINIETQFDREGRWRYDGDYVHVGRALKQAGLKPFQMLAFEDTTNDSSIIASQVQVRLQTLRSQREDDISSAFHQDDSLRPLSSFPANSPSSSANSNSSEAYSTNSQPDIGLLPRRHWQDRANVDVDTIQRCIDSGFDTLSHNAPLHNTFPILSQGIERDATCIAHELDKSVSTVDNLDRVDRLKYLVALHALGHQTARLWAVQTAMSDVGQDIAQVIPQFESRVAQCGHAEHTLMGNRDVMASFRQGGIKKAYIAIGMCVDTLGLPTATAWLSGAEKLRQ